MLTSQVLELVKETLFSPVVVDNGLIRPYLKLRKKQLLASLAADMDDSFYFAHKRIRQIIFFMMNVSDWNTVIYEIVF